MCCPAQAQATQPKLPASVPPSSSTAGGAAPDGGNAPSSYDASIAGDASHWDQLGLWTSARLTWLTHCGTPVSCSPVAIWAFNRYCHSCSAVAACRGLALSTGAGSCPSPVAVLRRGLLESMLLSLVPRTAHACSSTPLFVRVRPFQEPSSACESQDLQAKLDTRLQGSLPGPWVPPFLKRNSATSACSLQHISVNTYHEGLQCPAAADLSHWDIPRSMHHYPTA